MISQSSGSFASSTVANFIKNHINSRYHFIQSELRGYINRDLPQTAITVASQQFYHYPPNIYPPIESATHTIGGIAYPLTFVNSQREWDRLNEIDFTGSIIPQYIFPRRDDFGIWPTPTTSGETISLLANMLDQDMTAEDITTTTVTVTSNDATITHVGTSFVAGMVGRWFVLTDGTNPKDNWYRIASFTDTSNIELESVYEGSTSSGESYLIGEIPEIPPELHEIIPHGVAADFFAGPRKDFAAAQAHNNYFFTGDFNNSDRRLARAIGGLLGAKKRYSSRGETALVHRKPKIRSRFDDPWAINLTDS